MKEKQDGQIEFVLKIMNEKYGNIITIKQIAEEVEIRKFKHNSDKVKNTFTRLMNEHSVESILKESYNKKAIKYFCKI